MTSLALLERPPVADFLDGVRISGFSSFSEYWIRQKGPAVEDVQVMKACLRQSRGTATSFDVGANIGVFTLAMAKMGYARIHSFEPIAMTFDRFIRNLDLNPQLKNAVVPNLFGLGAEERERSFVFNPRSSGQSKIATPTSEADNRDAHVRCMVRTLDEYVKACTIEEIQLLKIDVEGYETDVLRGGAETLASGRIRFVYLEIIPQALSESGSSVEELHNLLYHYRFVPVISQCCKPLEFDRVSIAEAIKSAGSRRNVLFQCTVD